MFKILARINGKDVPFGNVPLKKEEDWKLSSTGKTQNIGYGRFPFSLKGRTGYVQVTVALRTEDDIIELG